MAAEEATRMTTSPPPQQPAADALSYAAHYPQQPTRVRYRVMAFLCALSFLTYFDRFCIVRAKGDIQQQLGISDARMGWVLGAFWLAYALFEVPAGWLGDRYGARR